MKMSTKFIILVGVIFPIGFFLCYGNPIAETSVNDKGKKTENENGIEFSLEGLIQPFVTFGENLARLASAFVSDQNIDETAKYDAKVIKASEIKKAPLKNEDKLRSRENNKSPIQLEDKEKLLVKEMEPLAKKIDQESPKINKISPKNDQKSAKIKESPKIDQKSAKIDQKSAKINQESSKIKTDKQGKLMPAKPDQAAAAEKAKSPEKEDRIATAKELNDLFPAKKDTPSLAKKNKPMKKAGEETKDAISPLKKDQPLSKKDPLSPENKNGPQMIKKPLKKEVKKEERAKKE